MGDERRAAGIDVYFCTTGQRREVTAKCMRWWKSHTVELHVVTPEVVGCELKDFNRLRRVYADQLAAGDHIVTDDDVIPRCNVFAAWELFKQYPQFGTLSLIPENCNIYPWTEIEAFEDSEVMEHVSVGGLRFCRKGLPFPSSEGIGYDRTHADAIRSIGMKVGYFKNFKCKHLGEGKSTLWLKANL